MSIIAERTEQQQAAYRRYQRCRDDYKAQEQRLAVETIEMVEAPQRIEMRKELLNPNDTLGLERILLENDMLSVNYLAAGLRATQAVCRISLYTSSGQKAGSGTGVLVSPTLLLTNHHVLSSVTLATHSLAEFDYEVDINHVPKVSKTFQLAPEQFFYHNSELDFALVAVQPLSTDGTPLSQFGFFPMIEQSGKALIQEAVTIIQHPRGNYKQIALRNNRVLGYVDNFVHYETDTEPGSSGSPVVNDQWQLVALHHSGVPRKNSSGQTLTKDGHVWHPAMDEDLIDWIANEGVRISAICKHLRGKRDWQPQEALLIRELLPREHDDEQERRHRYAYRSNGRDVHNLSSPGSNGSASPITLDEFFAMVDNDQTTEAQLRPYLQLDITRSNAFAPAFKLNDALITDAYALEGDMVLDWVNDWARRERRRAYQRKVDSGFPLIKIVAEGDSWFQFPILLDDVIDHLMKRKDLAVYCVSAAGDLLSNMIAKGEYLAALEQEKPEFFLISGGGNDLVAGERLATVLHPYRRGRAPTDYLNPAFQTFEDQMRRDYRRLFRQLTQRFPNLKILCHGYDYPIPNGGQWLGKPMEKIGINDRTLQRQILRVIMDRMNSVIADIAAEYANVRYLDVRNTVSSNGWFDELHPLNDKFGLVANNFVTAIRQFNEVTVESAWA